MSYSGVTASVNAQPTASAKCDMNSWAKADAYNWAYSSSATSSMTVPDETKSGLSDSHNWHHTWGTGNPTAEARADDQVAACGIDAASTNDVGISVVQIEKPENTVIISGDILAENGDISFEGERVVYDKNMSVMNTMNVALAEDGNATLEFSYGMDWNSPSNSSSDPKVIAEGTVAFYEDEEGNAIGNATFQTPSKI